MTIHIQYLMCLVYTHICHRHSVTYVDNSYLVCTNKEWNVKVSCYFLFAWNCFLIFGFCDRLWSEFSQTMCIWSSRQLFFDGKKNVRYCIDTQWCMRRNFWKVEETAHKTSNLFGSLSIRFMLISSNYSSSLLEPTTVNFILSHFSDED